MRETNRRQAWARRGRMAALCAGVLLLAGCATGYSFVQPDVAGSGGYYTSEGPYTGQGYYDYYGTGPYYAGTSGYGYYNGSYPYSNLYGYYGGNYGYGSQWVFNLGISSVWNFPGYWGPWYTTGYPVWGCYSWRCGNPGLRHDHGHDDQGEPQPWLKPDSPRIPAQLAHGRPPAQGPSRPVALRPDERFANRRPLESASFAPHDIVRAPIPRPTMYRYMGTPDRPVQNGMRGPNESAFASRRALPTASPVTMPQGPSPAPRIAPQPTFRPAPQRSATPVAPQSRPARRDNTPSTKVQ